MNVVFTPQIYLISHSTFFRIVLKAEPGATWRIKGVPMDATPLVETIIS